MAQPISVLQATTEVLANSFHQWVLHMARTDVVGLSVVVQNSP